MDQVTYRQRIPARDRRLGRHVNHDARSRAYPFRVAERRILRSVQHERHVPVFNQGNLGSCVPNTGNGVRGTGCFYATLKVSTKYPLSTIGNLDLYRAVTRADPFRGEWEPDDTGSDGTTLGKVLTDSGDIAGFETAFGLDAALQALMDKPLCIGTYWYRNMFDPSPEGVVSIGGPIDGGHEYVWDGLDEPRGLAWFTNSWGTEWSVQGRFCMELETVETLLNQQGDVTVFIPNTEEPPQPLPDPDHVFATALRKWSAHPRTLGSAKLKTAGKVWLKAKGL